MGWNIAFSVYFVQPYGKICEYAFRNMAFKNKQLRESLLLKQIK